MGMKSLQRTRQDSVQSIAMMPDQIVTEQKGSRSSLGKRAHRTSSSGTDTSSGTAKSGVSLTKSLETTTLFRQMQRKRAYSNRWSTLKGKALGGKSLRGKLQPRMLTVVDQVTNRRITIDMPEMSVEPPEPSKCACLVKIMIVTFFVAVCSVYFLPEDLPSGEKQFGYWFTRAILSMRSQLSKSVSSADVLKLEKEMKKWRSKGLLPHEIIQSNFDTVAHGTGSKVKDMLDNTKISLLKQDLRLDALMMQAIVKSATPLKVNKFIQYLNELFSKMHNDVTNFAKRCGGKFNANAIVANVESNIRGLQLIVDGQRGLKYVKDLYQIIEKKWGDIGEISNKPHAPAIFKQDPVALVNANVKHDNAFKILCEGFVKKFPVKPEDLGPRFEHIRHRMKGKPLTINYKAAGPKKMPRVIQKFFYKYKQDATKIVDIIRCSFIFSSVKELYIGLDRAIAHFVGANRSKTPGMAVTDCVWIKDRFNTPSANGYRDIILMIRMPGTNHWAETQFHLKEVIAYKSSHMHKLYEFMRHFPNNLEIEEVIAKSMSGGWFWR